MSKQKKRLVFVGWGIWDIEWNYFWSNDKPTSDNPYRKSYHKRKDAIQSWELYHGPGSYREHKRKGLAIARKLWVEV